MQYCFEKNQIYYQLVEIKCDLTLFCKFVVQKTKNGNKTRFTNIVGVKLLNNANKNVESTFGFSNNESQRCIL